MQKWSLVGLAVLLTLPGLVLRVAGIHVDVVLSTFIYGLAIVGSAFLLAWGAEAAQVDVSAALAVAFVGLIAVLPEYAVDIAFAWKAGQDPTYEPYAIANMTGGNRLLVGAAWPMVLFLFWLRTRNRGFTLERAHAIEIIVLAAATVYSFILPFKGRIDLFDTVVLVSLFGGYLYMIARAPMEEPDLIGPAKTLGALPRTQRRLTVAALFIFAAVAVIAVAEPFAEGLIHTGVSLGIDEFLLVQWLAPLASEAPEFLVAGILAFRGHIGGAMGTLISSKINQWTLLVASLPVAYALSKGAIVGLPLDANQAHEVFLTAAQSAFAVAVLANFTFRWWEAAGLFGLFALQFAFPTELVRSSVATIYCVLAVVILIARPMTIPVLVATVRATLHEYAHPKPLAHVPVKSEKK